MQEMTDFMLRIYRELGENPFPVSALQPFCAVKETYRVAARLEKQGVLIRLKRDLFVLGPSIIGHAIEPLAIANRICAPSYVSREAALSHWGLIPELVVNVTSSRLGRTTAFDTPIGRFHYAQIDSAVYAIGLHDQQIGKVRFLCAGPEKALYDLLLARLRLNIRSAVEMRRFLFEDLRLEPEGHSFDAAIFDELITRGRKRRMVELMKEVLCHGAVR